MIRRCLTYMGVIALASTVTIIGAPGMALADQVRDDQWYLETLGISDAHELSQGEGVTIGVIDSGIDATHPDLENNVNPGKSFGDSKDDGLHDARDHGTSIASILAGHGHGENNQDGVLGIAPKAEIVSVAMHCDDDKCAGASPRDWWDEAFEYLIDQDVDIISASQNYSNDGSGVVSEAAEKGIPVVGSAGNSTRDYGADLGVQEESRVSWPARAPNAIPVSGVDQDGEFWKESRDLGGAAPQPEFGLSAPATDLPGAMPGGDYATNSGTSGSAPIVAGTLALIKSAYPDLDYTTWVARMLETVDDKGDEGYDDEYGWGIVNPLQALTEDVKYEGEFSDIESLAEDRLPLEEQGKDTSGGDSADEGNDDEGTADGNPIAAATNGLPMWMIIAIIAGLLIVTAAIITTIVLAQCRKKRQVGHNEPPSGGIPGPGGPAGPGSPPPGPPQSAPGNPTAAPPSGAGNPNPGSTAPGPPPPGPDGTGAPTSAPPATQHNPQTPSAERPNPPPQQPPTPGHPQANPPGGATPPGTNAPFTPPQ